jgi:hypothetical protein
MSRTVEIVGPETLDEILGRIEFNVRRSLVEMDLFSSAILKKQPAPEVVMKPAPSPVHVAASAPVKPDSRFIDSKSIDLEGEYAAMNKRFFGGKLGMYPMKWNRRSTSGAVVKWRKIPDCFGGEKFSIVSVEVSTSKNLTHQAFLNYLVHEMIHVALIERGIDDNHGPSFKKEMNRINSEDKNFHITVVVDREYEAAAGVSEYKPKDAWILVYHGPFSNKPHGAIVAVNKVQEFTKEIVPRYVSNNGQCQRDWNIDFYRHKAGWISGYQMTKRPGQYHIFKPEELSDLFANGKHVTTLKCMNQEDAIDWTVDFLKKSK